MIRERAFKLRSMTLEDLLKEYTNDEELINTLSCIVHFFTPIELGYEFVTYPIEAIINENTYSVLTMEICQLIDRIRTEERDCNGQEISKDLTNPINIYW